MASHPESSKPFTLPVQFDEAWLSRCTMTLVRREGDISYCEVRDPAIRRSWEAVRVSVQSPCACHQLERQFHLALDESWAQVPEALIRTSDGLTLLYPKEEDPDLGELLDSTEFTVGQLLSIGQKTARALSNAHASGVVHGNLRPIHIIVGDGNRIRLRGFQGTALTNASNLMPTPEQWPYVAPEQIRPADRVTDERSDLYALGVVLYRAVVGHLPFDAKDPAHWMHAHIAISPSLPAVDKTRVPDVVGQIILKLLAKDPRSRYQSADALAADLSHCLTQWNMSAAVTDFALGRTDFKPGMSTAQRLFGREYESQRLKGALRRVTTTGVSELLLVSGAPGAGKSALISEVFQGQPGHWWASGKSDLLQRQVPYGPFAQVFHSLATRALGRDEADLRRIRDSLIRNLDGNGRLLTELVPELEGIIGRQPLLTELPGRQAQGRATRTLLKAIAAFPREAEPLLLFLDDIQWADESTLLLLTAFLSEPPGNVLLIVAYRDNEVEALRNSGQFLDRAAQRNIAPTSEVFLEPLATDSVAQLMASSLCLPVDDLDHLAKIVAAKTAGNPYFVHQIVRAMVDDQIIKVDPDTGRWTWSAQQVRKHNYADNVVDLMIERLDRLPPEQRKILRLASCVGTRCDDALLLQIAGIAPSEAQGLLEPLLTAGLLIHDDGSYTFPHDRLLEAAYNLVAGELQAAQHGLIAAAMLDVWGDKPTDRAFEIANQIQRTSLETVPPRYQVPFIRLLISAAERAKDAAALNQAAGYLSTAKGLLGDPGWAAQYAACFEAHRLYAECELQLGHLQSSASLIDDCLRHARPPFDMAIAFRLKATLKTLQSDYESAISAALSGLRLLDINLERNPDKSAIDQSYEEIIQLIGDRPVASLGAIPKCADPIFIASLDLLSALFCTLFIEGGLRFTHLAKIVELTLRHGSAPASAQGLAWFGVMIADRFGAYARGLEFAQAAEALDEAHGDDHTRAATLVAMDRLSSWTLPIKAAVQKARQAISAGQAGENISMVCYACYHVSSDLLAMGERLVKVEEEISRGLALVGQYQYADVEHVLQAQKKFVSDMRHGRGTLPPARLHKEGSIATPDSGFSSTTAFYIHLYAGMTAYFYHDFDSAIAAFKEAERLVWAVPGHINLADYYLYSSLAETHPDAPGSLEQKLRLLRARRERFAGWAAVNPATFKSKLMFIEGMIAMLQDDDMHAIRCFDESAIASAAAGFVNEYALAHEMLGTATGKNGLISGITLHMRVARDWYRMWGGDGKADWLEKKFSFLASEPIVEHRPFAEPGLDLAVSIQTAKALSEEVLLDRLVVTLVNHLMVQAGADLGVLYVVQSGKLNIAAAGRVAQGEVVVDLDNLAEVEVPASILNATFRTRKALVLDDVHVDCPEAYRDDYVLRHTRSVLCLPLLRQGSVLGLVYLENSLSPGIFNEQRLSVLDIVATQAAVSLDTARLYEKLVEEAHLKAQVESELRQSREELARSAHLTVMGELSASISHEISQPLLGIVSNADASLMWLTRDNPDIEEAVLGLEDIRADGARATNIVKALRQLAKQAPPQLEAFKLDDLLREVLRLTAADIERQNVTIQAELAPNLLVNADLVQIQQVFYNLINNAVEAVSLNSGDRIVRIEAKHEDARVCVRVDDNGPGIAEENRDRIFEAFFTTKGTGLGMGLAICRTIMKAHGGNLIAENNELGGGRICFSLIAAGGLRCGAVTGIH